MDALDSLTPREREVLRMIATGLSYAQIARVHKVALVTVRNQARLALDKLGVSSRHHAALLAWRAGIISIDEAWVTLMAIGGK